MVKLEYAGIVDASTIDCCGKGTCAVVYLCGCPFRCPYCHNPELVNHGEICMLGDTMDIVEQLKQNYLVQSVTLTGGEPLMQKAAFDLIKEIKDNTTLKVKIDTNGFYPKRLLKILPQVDAVSMDLKASFDRRYGKASGHTDRWETTVETVKKSLEHLKDWTGMKEARTTIVPGIVNTKGSIREIAKEVADAKFGRYILQQFRPEKTLDSAYMKKRSLPYERMHDLGTEAKRYLPGCRVYTVTSEKGICEVKAR